MPPSTSTLYHNTWPLFASLCGFVYTLYDLNSGTSITGSGFDAAMELWSKNMIVGVVVLVCGIALTILGRYLEVQENQRNRILNSVGAIRKQMNAINVNTGWASDDEEGGALDGLGDISFSFQPSEQRLLGFGLGAYTAENYQIEMNEINASSNSNSNSRAGGSGSGSAHTGGDSGSYTGNSPTAVQNPMQGSYQVVETLPDDDYDDDDGYI